jgi:hypothetical protein
MDIAAFVSDKWWIVPDESSRAAAIGGRIARPKFNHRHVSWIATSLLVEAEVTSDVKQVFQETGDSDRFQELLAEIDDEGAHAALPTRVSYLFSIQRFVRLVDTAELEFAAANNAGLQGAVAGYGPDPLRR